jgi:SAM-dependent methyltransferase
MRKSDKKSSRELGLEVAAICGRHFFKTEHLHYGLWTNGLSVDLANLHTAQEKYTQYLLEHIPQGVKTVLDVGCGTGKNARRLLDMGYMVDCVSPSSLLSEWTSELLGKAGTVFTCRYEQLQTERRYDCILFSESFQYVNLDRAIEQSVRLLNDGGYLLVCDVFKRFPKEREGNNVIGGGHYVGKFLERAKEAGLEQITDEDITAQTAPSVELLDNAMRGVVGPVLEASLSFLRERHPMVTRLLCWRYKKKLAKVRDKYMNGHRTSDDFRKYKTYRLFMYKK